MAGVSKGAVGELLAARFLREKGYRLLASGYRCRFGEIDIIAEDGEYIAFVEVKTRSDGAMYTPREAVTAAKRDRIRKTALLYLQQHPGDLQPRFDVIEVHTNGNETKKCHIEHIRDAFDAGHYRG